MNVTVKSVVSRTLAVDNSSDADRKYEISAQVAVGGGAIRSIASGMLDDGAEHKVVFSSYRGTDNMRIEFNGAPERTEIMAAIDAFVGDIEENIEELQN